MQQSNTRFSNVKSNQLSLCLTATISSNIINRTNTAYVEAFPKFLSIRYSKQAAAHIGSKFTSKRNLKVPLNLP